ncbi:protein Z, vitamin K-dependent plasma glycoprotein b isoform X2 [Sinocyclocheilus anshuiensis]|uniref:protein Z, vitamin K-dependent plasma glycoprotein b isoform X2 n=2 Tax=Sinocyclocheilus anshuiensis TaxID=1608454 RepID=UPI0007B84FBD|nr:PREDICTED: vitamin K-dependent protein Z isoform X2 [Sinocyclocheilus anshuiensis]
MYHPEISTQCFGPGSVPMCYCCAPEGPMHFCWRRSCREIWSASALRRDAIKKRPENASRTTRRQMSSGPNTMMEISATPTHVNTVAHAGMGSVVTHAHVRRCTAAPTVKLVNVMIYTNKSQCPSAGPLACEHFCKPMTGSFRCFCARGYTLNSDGRSCSPHVQNPCGTTETPSFCPDGHCSWEVKFVNTSGDVVCHGVVLGRKSVLTSATCMSALKDPHVTLVGRHSTVALRVSSWTPHKRYVSGAEDDLAFLELMEPFPQNTSVVPLCLPERDYSENILMRAGRKGVVMGGAGHSYLSLDDCHGSLNLTFLMTNKMFCMQNWESDVSIRTKLMPCDLKSGSPVATVEGKTAFLTGISLSTGDCNHGLVFTKLSRYLHWLRPLLHASEKEQQQQL